MTFKIFILVCICVHTHAFLLRHVCMCVCVGQRTISCCWLSPLTFMWGLGVKVRLSRFCYKCFSPLSLLFDLQPILF